LSTALSENSFGTTKDRQDETDYVVLKPVILPSDAIGTRDTENSSHPPLEISAETDFSASESDYNLSWRVTQVVLSLVLHQRNLRWSRIWKEWKSTRKLQKSLEKERGDQKH
jgi:hypothetical protein